MTVTNYVNNEIVDYSIEGKFSGKAKVVGIASVDFPITGKQYILEDISGNLPNEIYPYKTFVCYECWMSKK